MSSDPIENMMAVVHAIAERAAVRELAAVKAAIEPGRINAVAHAFIEHARYLATAMSWRPQESDLYALLRLQKLRSGPLPPDADFLRDAAALLIEIHTETESER